MNTTKTSIILLATLTGSSFLSRHTLKEGAYSSGRIPAIEKAASLPRTVYKTVSYKIPFKDGDQNDKQQEMLKKELGIVTFKRQQVVHGIVFRIQLAASRYQIPLNSNVFKGCRDVREYNYNGLYKYTAGEFKSPRESEPLFFEFEGKGFHDTFLVAFKDDKPLKMLDAMATLKIK